MLKGEGQNTENGRQKGEYSRRCTMDLRTLLKPME